MEYAMLATLIPESMEDEYRRICRRTMQDAANALQQNLYDGFCANLGRSIPVFNILPVSSFPQYCTKPFIPSVPLGEGGRNLGFCNIKLIRNRSKSKAIFKALKAWCESGGEEKTLFVYTVSQPFLAAVSRLKRKFPRLRVCAIVADLPNMSDLSSRRSVLARAFSSLRAKDAYGLLPCVDCFALLTKHMAEYMKLTQPWCVMEGIASEECKMQNAECGIEVSPSAMDLDAGRGLCSGNDSGFGLPPASLRSSTPLINAGGEGVAEALGDCHGLRPRNDSITEGDCHGLCPRNDSVVEGGERVVLYSGTLHRKFGVMRLVEAFSLIDDPQLRLVICGIGDSEEAIGLAARKDDRISFLGQLKRDEVLALQKRAAVLVNPRPGNEEFTKYSFPSKTMEYLASGVPVVAYRLAGIPEEYDGYLNYPENDSVDALARRIGEIAGLPAEERFAMGQKGRSFVLKNKNALVQTQRILELLKYDEIRKYPAEGAGQISNQP